MTERTGHFIATGLGATEGPIIRQRVDYVVTSVSQGRLYRIDGDDVTIFGETGGGPNGATEGADGRIYIAQNGRGVPPYRERLRGITGGVQVVGPEGGEVDWVTQDPVSPNDLCFGPDGLLYVTDPTRPMDRSNGRLWSVNVETGDTEILAQMDYYPNGIGFGLDAHLLVVADYTNFRMLRFPLEDGKLGTGEAFIQLETAGCDGFAFDVEGNLVLSMPRAGRIETWSMDGKQLDVLEVRLGEHGHGFTNIALSENGVLIGCGGGGVMQYDFWPAHGIQLHPFRR